MKVLVACEFSGIVRDAFIKRGHDAVSCDLLPTERPGPHLQGDVLEVLGDGWDMMIAHPPCTYICSGSMNWINREVGRKDKMYAAIEFCKEIMQSLTPKIAMENPIGRLSTLYRKPDQIFRVWEFGHEYKKDVCLWLKGLPPLKTSVTKKPDNLKTFDFWSGNRYTTTGGSKKSVTFQGIADAMAEQWG